MARPAPDAAPRPTSTARWRACPSSTSRRKRPRARASLRPTPIVAVRARLPADLQVAVTIAYTFGWRMQSEVLALETRQLDLAAGTLRLDPGSTKNDEGRRRLPHAGAHRAPDGPGRARAGAQPRLGAGGAVAVPPLRQAAPGEPAAATSAGRGRRACKAAGYRDAPARLPADGGAEHGQPRAFRSAWP